jgi:hypothetical protein
VKESSSVLKRSRKALGASQDMQIVDNGTSAQVEEILAHSSIPSASPLPPTDVRERMLNRDPLAQDLSTFRRLLSLA